MASEKCCVGAYTLLLPRPSRVQILPAAPSYQSYAVVVKKYNLDIRSRTYKLKLVHLCNHSDVVKFCRYVYSRVVTNKSRRFRVYNRSVSYASVRVTDRIAVETVPVACV